MTHLALFIAIVLAEISAYLIFRKSRSAARTLVMVCIMAATVVATSAAAADSLHWLAAAAFVPYRLINQLRFVRGKGLPQRLRRVSLRSVTSLALLQLAAYGIVYIVGAYSWWSTLPLWGAVVQVVVIVALLVSTVSAWRRFKPKLDVPHLTDHELPTLSVLVPARNETIDLHNCLEHLVASDYPKLEIIALDDCSADRRTPEIIRSFAHAGVRFVQGKEPPQNWLAKNHAYRRLAEEASGELLLFCGVDVLVEPKTLRRLVELMLAEKRDMLSLLPLRPKNERRKLSFIQAMRYWWELGFPRRTFRRPPVLSTLWLIRSETLTRHGGFASVAQTIIPEAHFAKSLSRLNRYMFIRSTPALPVYSTKGLNEQYATAIRVRYPQLHRRIEMVAVVTLFELFILLGPFVLLPTALLVHFSFASIILWGIAALCVSMMYYLIAIRTHLNNLALGFLTAPVAFILDICMLHNSMWKYEFSEVIWRDHSVSRPMLEAIPKLPTA